MISTKNMLRDQLTELLLPIGFVRRGTAFFRICGNDVLQIVKFQYEPRPGCYMLYFGLFSMYDEISQFQLTTTGCIPQYFVGLLYGDRDIVRIKEEWVNYRRFLTFEQISTDEQISMLVEKGIPFLNEIDNQEKLIQKMIELDHLDHASDAYSDMWKFVPYLYLGNGQMATKEINKFLILRRIPEEYWDDLDFLLKTGQQNDERSLRKIHLRRQLAKDPFSDEARAWLQKNYLQNWENTKFCRKGKRDNRQPFKNVKEI